MGGMIPAVIATLTAAAVTNVGSWAGSFAYLAWFGPTIVLVPVLMIWSRKYERQFAKRASPPENR